MTDQELTVQAAQAYGIVDGIWVPYLRAVAYPRDSAPSLRSHFDPLRNNSDCFCMANALRLSTDLSQKNTVIIRRAGILLYQATFDQGIIDSVVRRALTCAAVIARKTILGGRLSGELRG